MMKAIFRLVPVLLVLACLGCSGNVSVTGKVLYTDGEPVTVGKIVFADDKFETDCDLRPDGSYAMGRIKDGDGIPKGTYSVYLRYCSHGELGRNEIGEMVTISVPLVDPKYMDPNTSALTCTVEKATVFNVQVERPPSK